MRSQVSRLIRRRGLSLIAGPHYIFNARVDLAEDGTICVLPASDNMNGNLGQRFAAKCNHENDADAKFRSACGAALGKSVACPDCHELNDPDARFCDNCGRGL